MANSKKTNDILKYKRLYNVNHTALLNGYFRELSDDIMPSAIQSLITTYYPLFQVYGIGPIRSFYDKIPSKFSKLHTLSSLMTHCNDIHCNYEVILVKTITNEIFIASHKQLVYFKDLTFRKMSQFSNKRSNAPIICDGSLNRHFIIQSSDCQLFGSGNNGNGQYGMKTDFGWSIYDTEIPPFIDSDNDTIVSIHCGEKHTIFLTENGRIWCTGNNEYGQCGESQEIEKLFNPKLITTDIINHKIIQISAGGYHNIAIDNMNNVWIFGSNEHGNLGVKNQKPDKNRKYEYRTVHFFRNNFHRYKVDMDEYSIFKPIIHPYFHKNGIKIVRAECGGSHSLCLSDERVKKECFVFGNNNMGQLGVNDIKIMEKVFEPQIIKLKSNESIVDISAGSEHTLLLTENNNVFAAGNNNHNQCSVLKDDKIIVFQKISKEKEIKIKESDYIEKAIAFSEHTMIVVNVNKK